MLENNLPFGGMPQQAPFLAAPSRAHSDQAGRKLTGSPFLLVRSAVLGRFLPALLWAVVSYPAFRSLLLSDLSEPLESLRRGLAAAFAALAIALFLLRHPREGKRASLLPSVIAYAGTFCSLLLVGAPVLHRDPLLLAVSDVVCLAGFAWSLFALATLGRCFGIRPAARGLVTRGPYRLVRHPLYLGELTFALGIALPLLSPFTAVVWLLLAGLQLRRAINEEQTLAAAFPSYSEYRSRTGFLIPFGRQIQLGLRKASRSVGRG